MKMLTFAKRNAKEILRDSINLGFGLGFPLVLIFLLSAIQSNVPVEIFELSSLTPGISVFGLSFMSLFSAVLISKDRSGAFLQRLYTTPLRAIDFILGYTLPLIPMALIQSAICYIAALFLGLKADINILYAILFNIFMCIFYISLGLLCRSIFTDKQVGGICGALLTNLSAWLSGTWFDLELVGGWFKKAAYALPFVHGVKVQQYILSGEFAEILPHICNVGIYMCVTLVLAVVMFLRQMKRI